MTAAEITRSLGGRWHGSYGTARCPAHEDRHPSLSLRDSADGRLLVRCHAGCDGRTVLAALRHLGLLDGRGAPWQPDPVAVARRRAEEEAQLVRQERRAKGLWAETRSITGTPAEAYLRGRGITCPLPAMLRFHSSCWHPTAQRLPALVSLVEGGERLAIHRIYIREDGSGKAAVEPQKAMLGPTAGGAVRLFEVEGALVVTEGVETALALCSGLLRRPATVWAALSTSGMKGLKLPPTPGKLIIASDGDEPGRAAAHALAARARASGWRVSLLPAPMGADWADVLAGKKGVAA